MRLLPRKQQQMLKLMKQSASSRRRVPLQIPTPLRLLRRRLLRLRNSEAMLRRWRRRVPRSRLRKLPANLQSAMQPFIVSREKLCSRPCIRSCLQGGSRQRTQKPRLLAIPVLETRGRHCRSCGSGAKRARPMPIRLKQLARLPEQASSSYAENSQLPKRQPMLVLHPLSRGVNSWRRPSKSSSSSCLHLCRPIRTQLLSRLPQRLSRKSSKPHRQAIENFSSLPARLAQPV
mmetsp:Transcript_97688/g.174028  ORF Transcript_97688/g.174028 Transcript_97688/m.174028 type:complete len:232 (+) Transcript_97688:709-1404(+)